MTDQGEDYGSWREGRVRGLVVPPDGTGELRWLDPELTPLKAIVGGWLEGINGKGWHAYCDEEGELKQLPVNMLATKLALLGGWPTGDVLCGPVVFLGNGKDGEEADVPEAIADIWRELTRH